MKYLMSWEGSPAYRWRKMFKGQRYYISCEELDCDRTKDASGQAANEWWRRVHRDIVGKPKAGSPAAVKHLLEAFAGYPLDTPEAIAATMQEFMIEFQYRPLPEGVGKALSPALAQTIEDDIDALLTPLIAARRVSNHVDDFLAILKAKGVRPKTYKEVSDYLQTLPQDMSVEKFDEAKVQQIYLDLSESELSPVTKKKRWAIFKRFIAYLGETRRITIPSNLNSRLMRFKVSPHKIREYDPTEVKEVLKALKPRLRLYAMLGLNCGMTNVDIGALRKDQVDLEAGRLVRKRVKTSDHADVPEVDYLLWPETIKLLRECQSEHCELFLTSQDGTCLWEAKYGGEEGKVSVKDLIHLQWKRAKVPIPLKAFRSIAATAIERHENFGRYKLHFLGHSPRGTPDKHYAPPSKDLFDKIMKWLRGTILH